MNWLGILITNDKQAQQRFLELMNSGDVARMVSKSVKKKTNKKTVRSTISKKVGSMKKK